MIRQHFYPKTYFRHRSLSKGHSQRDSFTNENYESRCPKEIQSNQIKFNRKKSFVHDKNVKVYITDETLPHEETEKSFQKVKTSTSKIQAFIQQQAHTQIFSEIHTAVLKQIHNRAFKEVSTQQRIKPTQRQEDIKNLYVKSDRKQIVNAGKGSYRVLQHSYSDNDSFMVEGEWIKAQKKRNSTRKLASADASHRCYRKSIQRKKKKDETPAEIIINASLSTVDVPNHKFTHSERTKQVPVFEKITQNLINLNLSKAIKFRQSSMQDKIRKQRKNSKKLSMENIENRNNQLEQKVRGWEIMIEDDVDFS